MATINLNRSPFLSAALAYIRANPGCNKRQVINAVPGNRNRYTGQLANRTYSYRNAALDTLLRAGLVRNACNNYRDVHSGGGYCLVASNVNPWE